MCAEKNQAPIIIKRKKSVSGGGHHGGAWKVAYADFVTAMMAFFMLMWLLNATTEKQRKGLADYFSPTIPISRVSGGGDGPFGGNDIFAREKIAGEHSGSESFPQKIPLGQKDQPGAAPRVPPGDDVFQEEIRKIEEALKGLGGESMASDRAARHIVTRVTDEGLIVALVDLPEEPLFALMTARPEPILEDLAAMLVRVFSLVENSVAVNGHVRALPEVLRTRPEWDLSVARAQAMRRLLEEGGLPGKRIMRVTGFADREPALRNLMAPGNNRLELVLLRSDI